MSLLIINSTYTTVSNQKGSLKSSLVVVDYTLQLLYTLYLQKKIRKPVPSRRILNATTGDLKHFEVWNFGVTKKQVKSSNIQMDIKNFKLQKQYFKFITVHREGNFYAQKMILSRDHVPLNKIFNSCWELSLGFYAPPLCREGQLAETGGLMGGRCCSNLCR